MTRRERSYMELVLAQTGPLDADDMAFLSEWLRVLKEDCELFGAAPADITRMDAIEKRLALPTPPEAKP